MVFCTLAFKYPSETHITSNHISLATASHLITANIKGLGKCNPILCPEERDLEILVNSPNGQHRDHHRCPQGGYSLEMENEDLCPDCHSYVKKWPFLCVCDSLEGLR